MNFMKKRKDKGFTLLELLIVIAIIAILSVALVIVLNPAETLKKARDAQRISDLSTLKTAMGLYMTGVTPVYLGATGSNAACQTTAGTWGTNNKIFYSVPSITTSITGTTLDGGTGSVPAASQVSTVAANGLTNGTGWIPVNFTNITGGSPISNIPVDPINTVSATPVNTDLVYRYACAYTAAGVPSYEIDASLESAAYTTAPNDMRLNDGGNSNSYYETGTNLLILGHSAIGTDF
jgi:prepilin-type N-terminal cleavage/methylation domain-containing protein